MKKILLFLLILISARCYSQADTVKISVQIQARDAEYIANKVAFSQATEDLFDSLKVKFRVENPPTGNTIVIISGIQVKEWLIVALFTKIDYVAQWANVASRIDANLRAVNNAYMTGKLDEMDAAGVATYNSIRTTGRFKLRRQ